MDCKDMLKNAAPIMICLLITFGFFSCLYRLSTVDVPASNRDLFNIMIGVLGTVWVKSTGFFFDSSASSKQKDETISQIATAASPSSQPINIPDAKSVSVATKEGDVNVTPKA